MPLTFADHQYPNQVLVIVSGETSIQEMMSFIVTSRGGNLRHFAFLFDISAATFQFSGDDLKDLAAYAADEASTFPVGPVAFVSTDPATFGMGRMYQSSSAARGRGNVGVFHTMADAQTWLAGLNPPH